MENIDHEIVLGLKSGSEAAFAVFFKKYSQSLYRHIYRVTGNREVSEELLNETIMMIIKKINFYKDQTDQGSSFKSWIFRIATNVSIDFIRKEKRRKLKVEYNRVEEEEGLQESPEKEMSSIQEQTVIYKKMMELPTLQRLVLNLKVKEEMSYIEISRVCGCSLNSVKQALFKARINLKKKLEAFEVHL